jgi:hypothetical protein
MSTEPVARLLKHQPMQLRSVSVSARAVFFRVSAKSNHYIPNFLNSYLIFCRSK